MAVNHNINVTATDKTGQALSRIDKKLGDIDAQATKVTKALGAAGAAALAFTSGGIVGGMIKQYTAFEKYNTVLATYLGSQSAANSEMKRLQSLANALPQDLNDITQAFVLFTSRGIDTSSKSLTAFSNIATANGKSLTQLGEAVADALTGEYERLKEFGIKVSKENGKFVADIGNGNKIVGDSAAQLVDKLRALGEEGGKFGSAAANNAATLAQTFSNLQGAIMEASVAFGSGLGPGMKTFVQAITDIIRQNKEMISQMGKVLGNVMVSLGKTLVAVADNIDLMRQAAIGFLGLKLGTAIAGLAIGFKNLMGTILGATKGLTSFNKASLRNLAGALLGIGLLIADNMGLMDKLYQKLGLMDKPDAMDPLITKLEQVTAEMEKVVAAGGVNEINKLSERTAGMLAQELMLRKQVNAEATKKYEESLKLNKVDIESLKIMNQTAASIQQAESALSAYMAAKKAVKTLPELVVKPSEEQQNYAALMKQVESTQAAEALRLKTLALVRDELKSGKLAQDEYNRALEVEKLLTKGKDTAATRLIAGLNEQNTELTVLQAALKNVLPLLAGTTVTEQQATKAIKERITALQGGNKQLATYATYLQSLQKWITDDTNNTKWAAEATKYLAAEHAAGKLTADQYAKALEHVNGKAKESTAPTYAKYLADLTKEISNSRQQTQWAAQATGVLNSMYQQGLITLKELTQWTEKLNGKKEESATDQLINKLKAEKQRTDELTESFMNAEAIARKAGVSVKDFRAAITGELGTSDQKQLTVGEQIVNNMSDTEKKLEALRDAYANADEMVRGSTVSAADFRAELQKQINALVPVRQGIVAYESEHAKMAASVKENWKNIGDQMSKSMSDAVAKGELTFSSFKDFLKGWAQEVMSQIIKKTLMDPLTQQLSSLGASLVNGISGSIMGSGGGGGGFGGVVDFITGLFKASGGPVSANQPYIVGEQGPEVIMPRGAGTVVPNDALGGGGLTVNFTIQAIDSKSGTEFILNNKQQIVGVIQDAYNRRGRQGIY